MSTSILAKTNGILCTVILLGFIGTSALSYRSNVDLFRKDIEYVTDLTSEGIYCRLKSFFTKHLHISLTMANDSLLKELLAVEQTRRDDPAYVRTISTYLDAYRRAYAYDSVFLVSTATDRYYNFSGIDRILTEHDPENDWYYQFLASNEASSLNVDNDEAARNEITVFINCRIAAADGRPLGVVGVGLRVSSLQSLLHAYETEFGVKTFLINNDGMLAIGPENTGYPQKDHFDASGYPELKQEILAARNEETTQTYWLNSDRNYLVARYIPELSWHLLIEHDTSRLDAEMRRQLLVNALIVFAITGAVLLVVWQVVRSYNKRIIMITELREQERQAAFRKSTEQLYDTIYEMNISDNRAASKSTEQHFAELGVPASSTYDDALRALCNKQVKKEHREGVLRVLSRENILREYQAGHGNLRHDFMMSLDGKEYRWTRVIVHSYTWQEDGSVRMFAYFRNIDAERRRQLEMEQQAQKDGLTDTYNKAATRHLIEQILLAGEGKLYAFFILDIDNFKNINDQYGHAFGDSAIVTFARTLKRCFRSRDVVGRIGGDEFVAFVPVPDADWVANKARMLSRALDVEVSTDKSSCRLTASIGVAVAPEDGTDFETLYKNADAALYTTKKNGKNGFTLYGVS